MKKSISCILALVLAAAMLCACGGSGEQNAQSTQTLQLGTSDFYVTVDASYQKGTITEDDTSEGQVAYYKSEKSLLDFDVYQWTLAEGETLAVTAETEAEDYGTKAEQKTFGQVNVYFYNANEESEGKNYDTVSYLMENKGTVAEIVFWLDGEDAVKQADAIMNTLVLKESAEAQTAGIRLGTSALYIAPAKTYQAGTITAEDTDENQVGYFFSDETTLDFDVYMWAKAEGETLKAAAEEEAVEFDAEVKEEEFNGIKTVCYYAVEESEGEEYDTVTYIIEDGNSFVELVFWLDGENAAEETAQIMGSLSR